MPFQIGTDEAGYGPNLGPLTITGTLWQTKDISSDLYSELEHAVASKSKPERIFVADSKLVYKPSGSIANLETSVLALLHATCGRIPATWNELVELLCPPESHEAFADQVWLTDASLQIPVKANVDRIKAASERFVFACESSGVRLMEMQCVPVFPPQFNFEVERLGNKATLLSTETLKIVRRLMNDASGDIEIGCDKHGGRSRYAALIQEIITQEILTIGTESREVSDYSFRENDRDVVMRFQAKGESFLPTALASMFSKYLREVFMMLWNQYWLVKIPGIKPTKGYPLDAKRFKADIAKVQRKLGIDDQSIWRNR